MAFDVLLRPAAARDLAGLEHKMKARIEKAIDGLGENPRPPRCEEACWIRE
jgi:mRNA-degrading endonuclease RelE of RelBE toxin-antitoxin system